MFNILKSYKDVMIIMLVITCMHFGYYLSLGIHHVNDFPPQRFFYFASHDVWHEMWFNFFVTPLSILTISMMHTSIFGLPFFYIMRLGLCLSYIFAYLNLLRLLGIPKVARWTICILIVASPDFYIVSNWWTYESLVFYFSVFLISTFASYVFYPTTFRLFLFLLTLAILGCFRTFYGLLFYFIVTLFFFFHYLPKTHYKKFIIASLLPLTILLVAPVKNYIFYGVFSSNSTYDGLPLSTFFEMKLPRADRIEGVQKGLLPEIVLCMPGPQLGNYPIHLNNKTYTWETCQKQIIPAVGKKFIIEKRIDPEIIKKTREDIYHLGYWKALKDAAFAALIHYPAIYLRDSEGLRLYFTPTFPYILPYLTEYRDVYEGNNIQKVKWLFKLSDLSLYKGLKLSAYPATASYLRMILYPFIVISLLMIICLPGSFFKLQKWYFISLLPVIGHDWDKLLHYWPDWGIEYSLMFHLLSFNLIWAGVIVGYWIIQKIKNARLKIVVDSMSVKVADSKEKIILSFLLLFILYTSAVILLGSAVDQQKNRQPLDALYLAGLAFVVRMYDR